MSARVTGLGWWSPGFADAAAWTAGLPDPAVTGPRELIPPAARRRATWLSRVAADVLDQALATSGRGPADVALVFGSSGGELEQTFANLDLLAAQPPSSSPLRFGNSVHNAALGHLSIPAGNRHFASALSANPDQLLPLVLLEAVAWVMTAGEPVAVLWAEEAWPGSADMRPFAAALVLEPGEGPAIGRLGLPTRGGDAAPRDVGALLCCLAGPGPLALGSGWAASWSRGEG